MPLAALLSGALLAGASVPGPLGPLVFLGLAPLLARLARAPSAGRAFRDGFVAGAVYFGAGFGWVFQSVVGGGLALPLAWAIAIPLLASGFGLFALGVAWLARTHPRLALGAAPGLWVGVEFARSQEWVLAVPWNHLGYAIADTPALVQGASLFGLYGLSAWIVAVNAGLVLLPRLPRAAAPLLAVALAAPLAVPEAPAGGDTLRVAAVQPAIPEADRHVPARHTQNLRRLLDLTDPLRAERPELVVWPESAWERALGAAGDAFLAAIAHDLGTPLVTGAWHAPRRGETTWRNTAVLASYDGRTRVVAEKMHPVPVYERAPDGPLARLLASLGLWSGQFGRGAPSAPHLLARPAAAPAPVGVLVCIDASHPERARALRAGGAALLVSIANEAGTGAWSAALHARVARLRAVENRMPVLRVANTGPTLWIDANGRVAARLAVGRPDAAVHALPLAGAAPLHVRLGDRAVAGLCFLSALAMAAARLTCTRRGVE
jgi:apolipoprotein N-acyltransferase